MKFSKEQLKLYAITDRSWLKNDQTICDIVEEAILGGATMIQIREKEISKEKFIEEVYKIKPICKTYNIPLIINDDLEIALNCEADGVHLGQSDLTENFSRKDIPSAMILGISAQNLSQALKAESFGADYLGVGAVFPTDTKKDADNLNLDILKEITSNVSIPVVGIGGINLTNIPLLKGSQIAGVSIISAIFASDDIIKTTKELSRVIDRTKFDE